MSHLVGSRDAAATGVKRPFENAADNQERAVAQIKRGRMGDPLPPSPAGGPFSSVQNGLSSLGAASDLKLPQVPGGWLSRFQSVSPYSPGVAGVFGPLNASGDSIGLQQGNVARRSDSAMPNTFVLSRTLQASYPGCKTPKEVQEYVNTVSPLFCRVASRKEGADLMEFKNLAQMNEMLYKHREDFPTALSVLKEWRTAGYQEACQPKLSTSHGELVLLNRTARGPKRVSNSWTKELPGSRPAAPGAHLFLMLVRRTEGYEAKEDRAQATGELGSVYLDQIFAIDRESRTKAGHCKSLEERRYWTFVPVALLDGEPKTHWYHGPGWAGVAIQIGIAVGHTVLTDRGAVEHSQLLVRNKTSELPASMAYHAHNCLMLQIAILPRVTCVC